MALEKPGKLREFFLVLCGHPVFLRCLWLSLMDFCQTFVIGASWDKDELIRFGDQKVKG